MAVANRYGMSMDIRCNCAVCKGPVQSLSVYWSTTHHSVSHEKICVLVVSVKCHGKSAEVRIPEAEVGLICGPGLAFMDEKEKLDTEKKTKQGELFCQKVKNQPISSDLSQDIDILSPCG